ncbi:MAG TPA: hypothetical protein VJ872_03305 [Nocardioides sp.]|nr:hypothetical protein [Nocardioides sp.]
MRGVGDLVLVGVPKEFHGPIDYQDRWIWLALLGLLLVGGYYLAVLWFTRTPPPPPPEPVSLPDVRAEHLGRLDAIEAAVRTGEATFREGHQQLSEVVRSYVEAITPLPARTMTLADFRLRAPRPLADIIEEIYPPEFSPDAGEAAARFEHALGQARGLVSTWRR